MGKALLPHEFTTATLIKGTGYQASGSQTKMLPGSLKAILFPLKPFLSPLLLVNLLSGAVRNTHKSFLPQHSPQPCS